MKCNTILFVRSQQKATQFYEAVLGQPPTLDVPGMTEFQLSEEHILGLMPENGIKMLLGSALPDPVSKNPVPRAEIYLLVDDPKRHHQLALENGAMELSPFELRNWGDHAAYSLDLDGHVLVFARSPQQSIRNSMTPKFISVTINGSVPDVYGFASNPHNLAKWASGLSTGKVEFDGASLKANSPMGPVQIQFAPTNDFGVLDHKVILETGECFHNPMRVVPNGQGSEVTFTLFRQPNTTDEKFEEDAAWVTKDLLKLKTLVENL